MFDGLMKMIKGISKRPELIASSKDTAKERLHLVLMQDRANVSVDFLDLMKQEIIDVIKKYIEIDENSIDVRLTNKPNADGTNGAPALYANIPILDIKEEIIKQMDLENLSAKKTSEVKQSSAKKVESINNNKNSSNNKNTNNNSSKTSCNNGSKSTNNSGSKNATANNTNKTNSNKNNSNKSKKGGKKKKR